MSEQRPISERWTIDDMIIVATGKKDSDKATQAIQNAQTGLDYRKNRLQVYGYDRSAAQAARNVK